MSNYSLVSKTAIAEDFKGVQFHRIEYDDDFSGWIIHAMTEDKYLYFHDPNYFEPIENHKLYTLFENFKEIEQEEVGSIYIHNKGFDKLVKIQREDTLTVDSMTYATNQGNLKVDFKQWYKFNRNANYRIYAIAFVTLVLTILTNPFCVILLFLLFKMKATKDNKELEVQEHFNMGDVIPGVVTSIYPVRIAALTDLTMGFGEYPAIKVMKFRHWNPKNRM